MKKFFQIFAYVIMVASAAFYTACNKEKTEVTQVMPGDEQIVARESHVKQLTVADPSGKYWFKFEVRTNVEALALLVNEQSLFAEASPEDELPVGASPAPSDCGATSATHLLQAHADLASANRVRVKLLAIISPNGSVPAFGCGFSEAFAEVARGQNALFIYDLEGAMLETGGIERGNHPLPCVMHVRNTNCINANMTTYYKIGNTEYFYHPHYPGKYCNKCTGAGMTRIVTNAASVQINYTNCGLAC